MSRAAVLFTGAVAALLVGRAALAYRGVDSLALCLVLLIGAGLVVGVVEGFVRATRAERLLVEARGLPVPATLEAVETASAPLRLFLDARIAGAPAIVTSAPFTPYLLGLLVMIGLLGTFLGLFETLRGAREALSASGDIASLRAGLTAPMTGLSRAFGTSATGVSASAMLGLGAVFVRRAEGRLALVLSRYAATALAPLTLAGRQLATLSALAKTSEALPEMVVALRESTLLIERLSTQLTAAQKASGDALAEAQRHASAEATSAIRATAGEIRADIERGITRAADGVTAAAQPLLVQAVARVGQVASDALVDVTGRLEKDAATRRERDGEHLAALGAALGRAVTAIEEGERRADACEALRMADAAARIEALVAVFTTQLESLSGRLADPLGRAALAAEASVETASRLVKGAEAQLGEEARAAAARGLKLDSLIATLDTVATRIADDAEARTALVETVAHTADARTEVAEARALARATELAEAVERTVQSLAEKHGAYEAKLLAERQEVATALSERLAHHARGLDESLRATATTVEEASGLLRSGGAEMVSVAEMFTAAVDRYREASDRWLDNLGAIEDAIAEKDGSEAAALLGSYVAQTREVFDCSLQFQRELFTELRALRSQRVA